MKDWWYKTLSDGKIHDWPSAHGGGFQPLPEGVDYSDSAFINQFVDRMNNRLAGNSVVNPATASLRVERCEAGKKLLALDSFQKSPLSEFCNATESINTFLDDTIVSGSTSAEMVSLSLKCSNELSFIRYYLSEGVAFLAPSAFGRMRTILEKSVLVGAVGTPKYINVYGPNSNEFGNLSPVGFAAHSAYLQYNLQHEDDGEYEQAVSEGAQAAPYWGDGAIYFEYLARAAWGIWNGGFQGAYTTTGRFNRGVQIGEGKVCVTKAVVFPGGMRAYLKAPRLSNGRNNVFHPFSAVVKILGYGKKSDFSGTVSFPYDSRENIYLSDTFPNENKLYEMGAGTKLLLSGPESIVFGMNAFCCSVLGSMPVSSQDRPLWQHAPPPVYPASGNTRSTHSYREYGFNSDYIIAMQVDDLGSPERS